MSQRYTICQFRNCGKALPKNSTFKFCNRFDGFEDTKIVPKFEINAKVKTKTKTEIKDKPKIETKTKIKTESSIDKSTIVKPSQDKELALKVKLARELCKEMSR